MNDSLNYRLQNCLVTVLELEAELEQTPLWPDLQREFALFKDSYRRLERMQVPEHDVYKIEMAVSHFLAEIRDTLDSAAIRLETPSKVLQ